MPFVVFASVAGGLLTLVAALDLSGMVIVPARDAEEAIVKYLPLERWHSY